MKHMQVIVVFEVVDSDKQTKYSSMRLLWGCVYEQGST